MKAIKDFENVQESTGEFSRPTPNGYVCHITLADDYPLDPKTGKGDYLKIEFDIAEGDFKDYFNEQFERFGYWSGRFFRSYKEKALGMFKHFTNCVENSNAGYSWAWDEKTLMGKLIGLVLGEEEYENQNGEVKTRLYVKDIKTVDEIRQGDFKIPAFKKLNKPTAAEPSKEFTEVTDDDLPF